MANDVELARDVYGGAPSLQYETRKLMEQLSEDLGTRLDWVASRNLRVGT